MVDIIVLDNSPEISASRTAEAIKVLNQSQNTSYVKMKNRGADVERMFSQLSLAWCVRHGSKNNGSEE